MEFKELITDYSKHVESVNNLSEEQFNNIRDKLNLEKLPIYIKPVSDSDLQPGIKIYVGENNPRNFSEKKTWHIYNITYVRSGVVFYTRDNNKKENYFIIDCTARKWMFPMKVNIGNNSNERIEIVCDCPKVKLISNQ